MKICFVFSCSWNVKAFSDNCRLGPIFAGGIDNENTVPYEKDYPSIRFFKSYLDKHVITLTAEEVKKRLENSVITCLSKNDLKKRIEAIQDEPGDENAKVIDKLKRQLEYIEFEEFKYKNILENASMKTVKLNKRNREVNSNEDLMNGRKRWQQQRELAGKTTDSTSNTNIDELSVFNMKKDNTTG